MCDPFASAVVGVHDHVPSPATVAVHNVVGPSVTVIVSPATPLPEICGVLLVATELLAGAMITGGDGTANW